MIRVAFVGAPDSGKTTLAKIVSAELNLEGYVPAYVHECARDYITKHHVKPETVADQLLLFVRQLEREDEMCGFSTQIMYTDSPIILPYVYAIDLVRLDHSEDRDNLIYLYGKTLAALERRYDLIFLLKPFRETLRDDVRVAYYNHIDKIGVQIKAFLDLHGFTYFELDQNIEERVDIVKEKIRLAYN